MFGFRHFAVVAGLVVSTALADAAVAQRRSIVRTRVPSMRSSNSFHEQMGVGFGFNIPGARRLPSDDGGPSAVVGLDGNGRVGGDIRFRQGGAGGVVPGVGGANQAGPAGFGFGILGGDANLFFNFSASQGSRRGRSSVTPSVTTLNGGTGFFFDGVQRPFVTGVVPIVGGGGGAAAGPIEQRLSRLREQGATPGAPAPDGNRQASGATDPPETPASDDFSSQLGAARSSTAGQAPGSLADIHRRRQAESAAQQRDASALFEQGKQAEAKSEAAVARNYYRRAMAADNGTLRGEIQTRLRSLSK
jgi:hypothetical protein